MNKTILIVDDEPLNQKLAATILKKEPYTLFFANNGQECLDFLQTHHVDIILLDMNMPVLNGIETLQLLQAHPTFDQLGIIIVTAQNDTNLKEQGLALGANEYVTKPYDIIELKLRIQTISKLLELKKLQNSHTDIAQRIMESLKCQTFQTWLSSTSSLSTLSEILQTCDELQCSTSNTLAWLATLHNQLHECSTIERFKNFYENSSPMLLEETLLFLYFIQQMALRDYSKEHSLLLIEQLFTPIVNKKILKKFLDNLK